jgi:hypothetical protein
MRLPAALEDRERRLAETGPEPVDGESRRVTQLRKLRDVPYTMSFEIGSNLSGCLIAKPAAAASIAIIGLCTGGTALAQQGAPAGQDVRQACAVDFKAVCSGVQPGGGRIMACLQQHMSKLSPGCQQALTASKAAK